MSDKYRDTIAASNINADDEKIKIAVAKILDEHTNENKNQEVYKFLLNSIDLTMLNSTDSSQSVSKFVERVNKFEEVYGELKNVASICVYPCFASVAQSVLEVSDVNIACVSACFPSSQSFIEVKVAETALAIDGGADEIDAVFNLGNYFDEDYESACDEITELKAACRDKKLKIILETGALKTAKDIKAASILSLYSGADFLKTSTGKEYPGATHEAVYIMAKCIKEYHSKTGNMVGIKISGGVTTTDEAVAYYTIIKEVLGSKWLTNKYFRIGASRLANKLLSDIIGLETNFF